MGYENIVYGIDGDIATITFNRPKALNALNGALLKELSEALDDVSGNEDICVLILTGSGDMLEAGTENVPMIADPDIHKQIQLLAVMARARRQRPGGGRRRSNAFDPGRALPQ